MDERRAKPTVSRRRFLAGALSASAFAGIAIAVVACGDDESDGGSGPNDRCDGAVPGDVSLDDGHSHLVEEVCLSDSGSEAVLLLTGSGHTHSVTLSAGQVEDALTGVSVSATSSSNNGHTHEVTFN